MSKMLNADALVGMAVVGVEIRISGRVVVVTPGAPFDVHLRADRKRRDAWVLQQVSDASAVEVGDSLVFRDVPDVDVLLRALVRLAEADHALRMMLRELCSEIGTRLHCALLGRGDELELVGDDGVHISLMCGGDFLAVYAKPEDGRLSRFIEMGDDNAGVFRVAGESFAVRSLGEDSIVDFMLAFPEELDRAKRLVLALVQAVEGMR